MELRDQLQSTLGTAYTIERELSGGGMSRVFVAIETAFGRQVVVKVLPRETAGSVSVERFRREIMLAARLQHPHIVPLLSAGESDGLPYFTMPYVEGESLRLRLMRDGELPIAEGMRILREVATALGAAHEKGIVHRDIKPDNVLLSAGSAMVTDFGVAKALSASTDDEHAKVTTLGVALGTPAYMSPEQAAASPTIDARADIYAFGIMAYELFAGRPPFAGRSPQAILAAQVAEVPEQVLKLRPSLPPALAALVMRCLEKHPADRPQTAAEIVHALDAITTPTGGSEPTTALPATRAGPTRTMATRRIVLIAGALVLAGGAIGWWSTRRGAGGATAAAMDEAQKSIAVLPCTDGGDTASDYFAEGISDEVRSELAKLGGLRVKSQGSSSRVRGQDPQAAGKTLGVAAVLECDVRRSGTHLRVSADLVNVVDGSTVVSVPSFRGEAKDVFVVQDSIIRVIAGALRARLGGHTPGENQTGTSNPEAYDLFMRARHLADRRNQYVRPAIALYQRAIALDPNFARGYAGLAQAIGLLPSYTNVSPDSAFRAAIAVADRAIALDSTLSDGYAAKGLALMNMYRWTESERALRHAIELDPRSTMGHKWLGTMLANVGRTEEGVAELRLATALDPFLANVWITYGAWLWESHADSAAVAAFRRALELEPTLNASFEPLAIFYAAAGQGTAALRVLGNQPDSGLTAYSLGTRAFVYARAGKRREAAGDRGGAGEAGCGSGVCRCPRLRLHGPERPRSRHRYLDQACPRLRGMGAHDAGLRRHSRPSALCGAVARVESGGPADREVETARAIELLVGASVK